MISSDESGKENDVPGGGMTEDVARREVPQQQIPLQCNTGPKQDDTVDKVSCIRTC